MRLGGPVSHDGLDPEGWGRAARAAGYRAVYWPLDPTSDDDLVPWVEAARTADLVIAEVGAWSNPLSDDKEQRAAALRKCRAALDVADRIGARCAVNVVGSRNAERWAGPDRRDFDADTFDGIVHSVRAIVDAVEPTRSAYALETMPWCLPDSVDSYERLLAAIDRDTVAVHFDLANLINCPRLSYNHRALIDDFVGRLGPRIRSCHLKDITLENRLTVHLSECRPGTGNLDYPYLLRALAGLDDDLPVMLEHLPGHEYPAAAAFVRQTAGRLGLDIADAPATQL
jgi:sugar phosphate isomerase/epimerase